MSPRSPRNGPATAHRAAAPPLDILTRIGTAGRRRIPFVPQQSAADCGLAALAMVLGYHGRAVRIDELRQALDAGRDGLDAGKILEAGQAHGLIGRAVRLELEDLDCLPPGAILHWELRHFVVLERVGRRHVDIVDPAAGRQRLPIEAVSRSFTGIALLFKPGPAFAARKPGTSPLRRYLGRMLGEAREIHRVVATSLLLRLLALALPVLTGLVVERVVPHADRDLLLVAGIGVATVLGFVFLANLLRSLLLLELRVRVDATLMLDFLEHLLALPYAYFQRRSTGDLAMRLNSNTLLREVLTTATLSALLDGSLVLLYLLLLLVLSPALGLLVLALGAVQAGLFLLNRRHYRALMAKELQAQALLQGFEIELLEGIETVKAAGAERQALGRWSNLFVDALNVGLERDRRAAVINSALDLLALGSPLVVLWVGAQEVLASRLSLGAMLSLAAMAAGALSPLSGLVRTALDLETAASHAARLDDVLRAPRERRPGRRHLRRPGPPKGAIQLDNVSFAYTQGGPRVLTDVTLAVDPGQHVAIVGRSGSGKSTLARLLLGLYLPTAGRVRIDGLDLAEIDLDWLRRHSGFVPQSPRLFAGSLRANLTLGGPDPGLEAIERACREAAIAEDIERMPMGYDTVMIDGGASLSGGQRQRVALARALLGTPKLLILDEATSALDSVTEARVQRSLEARACTRVVVAQRLSTIAEADVIFVLEDGRLIEQGRHQSLLAARGTYADLVRAQAGLRIAG